MYSLYVAYVWHLVSIICAELVTDVDHLMCELVVVGCQFVTVAVVWCDVKFVS